MQDASSTVASGSKLHANSSVHPNTSSSSQMPLLLSSARQSPPQTPMASKDPMQGSTSSQMPSLSTSLVHDPPHAPMASAWFPLQSQSPAGMSSHPQLATGPGPLHTPHASYNPTQSSTSSQMPSKSKSANSHMVNNSGLDCSPSTNTWAFMVNVNSPQVVTRARRIFKSLPATALTGHDPVDPVMNIVPLLTSSSQILEPSIGGNETQSGVVPASSLNS